MIHYKFSKTPPMSFSFTLISKVYLLKIDSLWDAEANKIIIEKIEELIDYGFNEFIVELKSTPYGHQSATTQNNFINSTGLSFLISLLTRARTTGGDVVLCSISESTRKLLILTKLNKTFSVYDDLEAALGHFKNTSI